VGCGGGGWTPACVVEGRESSPEKIIFVPESLGALLTQFLTGRKHGQSPHP